MNKEWPDADGYPDVDTRNVLEWCERVDDIQEGDDETLPKMLSEVDTGTLAGVVAHYLDLRDDHRKLGDAEAPFSDWDHEVLTAAETELKRRGLIVLPAGAEFLVRAATKRDPSEPLH